MATYVLEAYVPRSRQERLADLHETAHAAARALRGEVRLLGSYYLPGDEMYFLFVSADRRPLVAELGGHLDVTVARIAEAVTFG